MNTPLQLRQLTGFSALLSLICLPAGASAPAADRERPNIVFFLIDDCSTHEFGCYGNKGNSTPNIDRLAASGIRFNAAWGTPLCMPSRALLLSGQYGFKTGVLDNGVVAARRGDLPNRITPLARTLQQAGYTTFMGGKWHLEGLPGEKAWGFDEYVLYGSLCEAAARNPAWRARYQGPWWPWPGANRKVLATPQGQCHPYATWQPMIIRNGEFVETGPDDFGPDILSRDVGDFIRRKAREPKPFFIYYAEHLTHQPHTSMHDPETADRETAPGMESNVRYVDFVIGQLVKTLKETGVWDNTVLMVSGDNPSDTLGKGFAAAIGAHVPLIIAGGKKWVTWQGETGCLTDFADVYPTCMELAGLDPATNPELSGKSLKPLLDGNQAHTRPWIFSYLGICRMVRDRQWCLDGLDQLWRCNESGNPFTFQLITKDKEDAEAARGRAGLEAILKGLPAVPDEIIDATPQFAPDRKANRAGNLSPVQRFQQLYRMGVERLMAMPMRKEGPTRAQIAARSGKPSPQSAEKNAPSGRRGKGAGGTVQERFDQMAATLGLSDEQKNKLMELQRAQYQQMLSGQGDLTPQQRMEQFKKFREELEQKIKESEILTDEQFAKWKEFQSQRFTGVGKTSGTGTMPKRTSPAPKKPAQPKAREPKPAVAPASVSSGIEDIDRVRREVQSAPTTTDSALERQTMLYAWLRLLMHQGVDLRAFEPIRNRLPRPYAPWSEQQCRAIDEGYSMLEGMQAKLPKLEIKTGMAQAARGGPTQATNWPLFHGGPSQAGYTSDPGPSLGRLAWRFPIGHTWYGRPAIEGDRVYVASPGTTTMAYCLDKRTGKVVWKARKNAPLTYSTLRVNSSVLIAGDTVIVRDPALVYIDKRTGRELRREDTGPFTLRRGYTPVSGDSRYLVYPRGYQNTTNLPPLLWNMDTLVARETASGRTLWAFRTGDIMGDAILDGDRIYVGTDSGVLYAFNAQGHERIGWQFRAGSPLRASPAFDSDAVYVASENGAIYALDRATGVLKWSYKVENLEPRSAQFFSTPAIGDGRVYMGAANRRLYCLDSASGKLLWQAQVSDWIRSRPVVIGTDVIVASMDGTVQAFGSTGKKLWRATISNYQVMADLAGDEAGVLVSTSDLYVYSLRVSDGTLQWRHSLLEAAYIGGERIPADMVATAADFQSSPTVVDGIVYVGAPNRFVYAVDAGSGREVWRFETSGHVAATPAVAEGRVYFGSEGGDKQFYAVDAKTGHPVWKRSLGWVWAGAGYAAGKLFVGTGEGDIVGLRAATGDILWKRETTGPIYTTPATDATSAYTGGFGGHYYALDQQTGDMRWAHFIPSGQYAAHPLTPDSNAPVVLGDRLFSAVGSSVFALDTKTGRRVWDQPIGSGGMDVTPAADGRQLVVSDIKWETNGANIGDTRLVSLDIKTGKVLWQYSPGGGLTGAVFARDRLFFASTSNPHVACVLAKPEPNSVPQLLWRYKLGGVVEESNPAIYGNRLYVLAADRYLYALE